MFRMFGLALAIVALGAASVFAAACGNDNNDTEADNGGANTPATSSQDGNATATMTGGDESQSGGDQEGEDEVQQIQLGSLTLADHGTEDVSGSSTLEMEADSFYFEPTFIRGEPGQTVTLKIENDSSTLHNFSAQDLGIDEDIPANGETEVTLTLPESGVAVFICKYHTNLGMNGEILVGDATPQAPSS